jgi:hypothetical protein
MRNKLIFRPLIPALIFATTLLYSCEKNSSTDPPQIATPLITEVGTPNGEASTAVIGSSGGTLNSTDGLLTVTIPTGALSSPTEISIQPVTNNAPLGLGSGYRLQPEGLTFVNPVQLTFHYNEQLLKESLDEFLWIVTQAGDGSWNAMLKSVPDKNSKTVSISTAHFSDWALGRFIDFTLNPSSPVVIKGESVELGLSGFIRDQNIAEDDELAPLIPITGDMDELTPLTPIPPIESRYVSFKIKQWTLNGVNAPVSNSNGSLSPSGRAATYTAPDQKPSTNPVAVSVQVETNNKEGIRNTFLITSNISVVDSDLHLLLKIDGQDIYYTQYGFTVTTPPDPDNFTMVQCGLEDGNFGIVASYISTTAGPKKIFEFLLTDPTQSTRVLIGSNNNGNDNFAFSPEPGTEYNMNYTQRTPNQDNTCDNQYFCSNITVTLQTYTGSNAVVRGSFSGSFYEDKQDYADECKMPDSHSVEGEFVLMMSN